MEERIIYVCMILGSSIINLYLASYILDLKEAIGETCDKGNDSLANALQWREKM